MLPSFILLSLSVNLSFCLEHHVCDSYPVNGQHLTCPCCHTKLPLEKELTAASQRMLWRPKAEQVSSVKGLSADSGKGKACQTLYVSPVPSEGCLQVLCLPYVLPEFTLDVALVLYLPTLFPATSPLINQKSVRIHFLPLLLSGIPDGRADPALPPSHRQLFASTHCFDFSFLQCSSHSRSLMLLRHHLFHLRHCPLSLHLSSLQAPQHRHKVPGP